MSESPVLWTRDHRRFAKLSTEIVQLYRTAERDFAETALEMGDRLREIRAHVEAGEWNRWLDEEVPFAQASANNYMRLSLWAQERPRDFERFKALGITKLYAIMTLPWEALRTLRRRKTHPVPGRDERATLEMMSAPEVHALAAEMRGDRPALPPIGRAITHYRRRVRGLSRATTALVDRRHEVDPEVAGELRDALLQAVRQLDSAFELG